jgi:hypothetical protein
LEQIPFINKLDRNNKYKNYINEYEEEIREYINKLKKNI